MKAIEKDRRRRYETANALAEDVERHLDDEPVTAGPPTAAYRTGKFLRRHKAPLAVAATIALLLIAGTAASTWQAIRANQRLAEAEAISTFLTTMIDRAMPGDPEAEGDGTTVTFAEALKQAETRLADDQTIPPERRAVLQAAIEGFNRATEIRDEITLQKNAVQFYIETNGPDHWGTIRAMSSLGATLYTTGRYDEAIPIQQEVLTFYKQSGRAAGAGLLSDAIRDLMKTYEATGRNDEAIALHGELLALEREEYGETHISVMARTELHAEKLDQAGRAAEALELRKQLVKASESRIAMFESQHGSEHNETMEEKYYLSFRYDKIGRTQDALNVRENLVALSVKAFGPDDDRTHQARDALAKSYRSAGRLAEANEIDDSRRPVTEDSPRITALAIEPTSLWRWLHPLDGVDPAESDPDFHQLFYQPQYDDSSWQSGSDSAEPTGGFGYGDDDDDFTGVDIGTPQSKELGKSAYFRHAFTTDREFTNLELHCRLDDGLIAYLDGTEVARDNMLAGYGAYSLPARFTVSDNEEENLIRIPLAGVTLSPGEHVLAISVHNTENPSSDLRIGAISLVEVE